MCTGIFRAKFPTSKEKNILVEHAYCTLKNLSKLFFSDLICLVVSEREQLSSMWYQQFMFYNQSCRKMKWSYHKFFCFFFSGVLWLADLDISDNQKRQDILGGSIFKPETSWQALLPSPCTQRVAKRACSQASSEKIFQIFAVCLSSCLNATSWLWFRKTQQGLAFLQKIQVKVQE